MKRDEEAAILKRPLRVSFLESLFPMREEGDDGQGSLEGSACVTEDENKADMFFYSPSQIRADYEHVQRPSICTIITGTPNVWATMPPPSHRVVLGDVIPPNHHLLPRPGPVRFLSQQSVASGSITILKFC